jgi:hypothetical protein
MIILLVMGKPSSVALQLCYFWQEVNAGDLQKGGGWAIGCKLVHSEIAKKRGNQLIPPSAV